MGKKPAEKKPAETTYVASKPSQDCIDSFRDGITKNQKLVVTKKYAKTIKLGSKTYTKKDDKTKPGGSWDTAIYNCCITPGCTSVIDVGSKEVWLGFEKAPKHLDDWNKKPDPDATSFIFFRTRKQ